ncbi:MAG: CopG family transcriptional regulator [Terriglobales bacterium]
MKASKVTRKGKPFTLYLSDEDARALENAAQSRRMTKAAIVRFALENVLRDLSPSNPKTKNLGVLTLKGNRRPYPANFSSVDKLRRLAGAS